MTFVNAISMFVGLFIGVCCSILIKARLFKKKPDHQISINDLNYAVILADREFRILSLNQAAERLFDSHQEASEQKKIQWLLPEWQTYQTLCQHKPFSIEITLDDQDDSKPFILSLSIIDPDLKNESVYLISLMELSSKGTGVNPLIFSRIIHQTPNIVFILHLDEYWSLQYISENIMRFGYSSRDFYEGEINFRDFIHENDRKWILEEIEKTLLVKKKDFIDLEFRVVNKSNLVQWIHLHLITNQDEEGHICCIQGLITDINDQKWMQEAERIARDQADSSNLELECLRQLAEELNQTSDLREALKIGLEITSDLLNIDAGWFLLIPENGRPYLSATYNLLIDQKEYDKHLNPCLKIEIPTQNLFGMFRCESHEINCEWLAEILEFESANLVHTLVPIQISGRLLGALNLISVSDTINDIVNDHLLEAISNQLAAAVERGRLYGKAVESYERERKTNQIALIINSSNDLDDILQKVVRLVVELTNASGGMVYLLSENREGFNKKYQFNFDKDYSLETISGTHLNIFWHILNSQEGLLLPDLLDTLNYPVMKDFSGVLRKSQSELVESGITGLIGVPIGEGGNTLGLLVLVMDNSGKKFSDREMILAQTVSLQIGIAIQKAQQIQTAQKRASEAETLLRAGSAVISSLDMDEIVDRILEQLARVVPYESATVQLIHEGHLEVIGGHGFEDILMITSLRLPLEPENPAFEVIESKRPQYLSKISESSAYFKHPPYEQAKSWLGVPLVIKDRILGLLALSSNETDCFTEDHIRLAFAFALEVAIALENARLFEEVEEQAKIDSLTGLLNRRSFNKIAEKEFINSIAENHPLSIIMIDIDRFKLVNDNYGHHTGDKVLRTMTQEAKFQLRSVDTIARYGGEEFICLLPDTNHKSAWRIAERIRKHIMEIDTPSEFGPIKITISLGVAENKTSKAKSLEDLIKFADQALYQSKQNGRNRVSNYRY
ncbi:MAG: diguanylate cyclase [Anaerolineaceae bacterium]|nr:diguanylate cyclase [Anaerolineaceae bacterium]